MNGHFIIWNILISLVHVADEAISSQLWINQNTRINTMYRSLLFGTPFFRDVNNQLLIHCKKRTRSWPISLKTERWYFVLVLAQPSFWTSILIDCNRKKVDIVSIVFLKFIYKLVIFHINNIVLIFQPSITNHAWSGSTVFILSQYPPEATPSSLLSLKYIFFKWEWLPTF